MVNPPRAGSLGLVVCHTCALVCRPGEPADQAMHCPRCHTRLYRRRPASLSRAWALLIAAVTLYFPANLMPVMYSSLLGNGGENTILAGVWAFWRAGSYGVAGLIFIASVVIPCIKFIALGLLLLTCGRGSGWARAERTRLYRFTEAIGYWSMLDVMVVAVVSALVKFQQLSDAEPRCGILFFALVVLFTLLCAMSFDPRLIWDGNENEP